MSGTSAAFLGEGPIAGGKGSWLASVRRSYLDYLIKRIDPEAGFAFGFVDAQAKAVYDFSPRHQVSITTLLGRAVFEEGDPDIGVNEIRTGHQPRVADVAVVAIPAELALRGHTASVFNRPALRQRQSRRRDARRRAVHRARVARRRARFRRRRAWSSSSAATLERLDGRTRIVRQIVRRRAARFTLNDYDEHAAAGSAYGQVRIGLGSRLTVTPGGRIDHWTLTAIDDRVPVGQRGAASYRATRDCAVAAASIVSFPISTRCTAFTAAVATCGPNARCTSMPASSSTLPHQTRLLFNVYARQERDVLWTPGSEPRLRRTAQSSRARSTHHGSTR